MLLSFWLIESVTPAAAGRVPRWSGCGVCAKPELRKAREQAEQRYACGLLRWARRLDANAKATIHQCPQNIELLAQLLKIIGIGYDDCLMRSALSFEGPA